MEKGKKQKHDADCPIIVYHTSTRTFDRLFKEETLSEMKEVARRKLGLDPNTQISFAQMREGKTVDLEDDDDFDAFHSLAHSTNFMDVRVIVGSVETEPATSIAAVPVMPTKEKTKKRKNRTSSELLLETDGGQVADDERDVHAEHTAAAAAASKVSFDTADGHEPRKKKRKANMRNFALGDDVSGRIGDDALMQPITSLVTSNAKHAQSAGRNVASTSTHISTPATGQQGAENRKADKKAKRREEAAEPVTAAPWNADTAPPTVKKSRKKPKTKGAPDAPIVLFAEKLAGVISETSVINGLTTEKAMETQEQPQEKKRKSKKRRSQSYENNQLNSTIEVPVVRGEMSVVEMSGNVAANDEVEALIMRHESAPPKRRKSTSDELKAAKATMDAAVTRILAAKRAALAAMGSVEPPVQESVISAQKTRQKRKRKTITDPEIDRPEAEVASDQGQTLSGTVELSGAALLSEAHALSDGFGADSTCPLCLLSPLHGREKCPLVLAGSESLQNRLSELQEPFASVVDSQSVIAELQQLLATARKAGEKDIGSPLNGHPSQQSSRQAQHSRLDQKISRPSSSPSELKRQEKMRRSLKTKKSMATSETSEISSEDAFEDESVGPSVSKDVSLLDVDLDNLIRGPNLPVLRAADIPSPESSDKETEQILEEEEDRAPRRSQKTGMPDSSDNTDSGLEEDSPIVGEYQDPPPTDDPNFDVLLDSGTDHISFQDIDQCRESQNADTSANAVVLKLANASQDLASSSQPPRTASDVKSVSTQVTRAPSRIETFVDAPQTGTTAIPAEQSAPPWPMLPPLTRLPNATSENENAEDARPPGIVQRMRTRSAKRLSITQIPEALEVSQTPPTRFAHPSQEISDNAAQRTRASTRRQTLGTVPVRFGRQSRLIRASDPSQPAKDSNSVAAPSSNSQDAMSLDTWVTLKASSPESTVMVDELEPSSPAHLTNMDVVIPKVNGASQDAPAKNPLFILTESQSPFPYSQWQEVENEAISNESDDENEVEASVQRAQPKASQALKYRRLTEITGDHGLFSTPPNLRPTRFSPASSQQTTDMYGRSGHEAIESESDSESDDSEQEQSHIPKSRRAGVTRK